MDQGQCSGSSIASWKRLLPLGPQTLEEDDDDIDNNNNNKMMERERDGESTWSEDEEADPGREREIK